MSTIPLARGFSEKHLNFPVLLSRKFDGVPVRIDITEDGWSTQTRQAKPMPSIEKLVDEFCTEFCKYVDGRPVTLVGEVIQWDNPDADFKETSGIVRRQYDQSEQLGVMLFDCEMEPGTEYSERLRWMKETIGGRAYFIELHSRVSVVQSWKVPSAQKLVLLQTELMQEHPGWEGLIARSHDDPWVPGKRSWGYQKMLNEPTIDLRIVGVEEAIDKNGNPKGMAGGLIASYKGNRIGIGPGRLTHTERIELWRGFIGSQPTPHYPNRIAQIKHKGDGSYDALRQPTFQHWRDDKTETDA